MKVLILGATGLVGRSALAQTAAVPIPRPAIIYTKLDRRAMKIKVETLSLNILESGAGEPTLLFLHYWGGSARTRNCVIEQLCSTFRCIAYDQRSWGESDAPADGYTISDLAGDAAALVCALDLKRYVLGFSARI